jgi:hypothetical protein
LPSEAWSAKGEKSVNEVTATEIGRLEALITHRLRGRLFDFRLVLRDDALVLQGRTRAHYIKQLAQHAIMEATGFQILANEIEVSGARATSFPNHA